MSEAESRAYLPAVLRYSCCRVPRVEAIEMKPPPQLSKRVHSERQAIIQPSQTMGYIVAGLSVAEKEMRKERRWKKCAFRVVWREVFVRQG